MADEHIRREDAIRLAEQGQVQGFPWQFQMLVRLPPADVVPVVHGRWIDDSTEFGCQCSECGKSLDDYVAPTEYASLNEIPNFCPNCGANMRGEQE